jgi:hypothetical protein
MVANNNAEGG